MQITNVLISKLINLDENLALKFSGYSKNSFIRNSLKVFEYFYHGLPWFLIVIGSCLIMSNVNKLKILFLGKKNFTKMAALFYFI